MCFSVSWSSEKHVKQLKENDLSERQYFGDAETSSSDSEEERCHYEDQFEAKVSKGKSSISFYARENVSLVSTTDTAVANIINYHSMHFPSLIIGREPTL